MKLIFLDIDGCFNSYRSDLIFGHERKPENLDPIALDLLRLIIEKTGAVICLSSEWRRFWDPLELGKNLKLPILFGTPVREDGERMKEINQVIDEVKPDKYIIIDDEEYDGEFEGQPWINVAEEDGFSYKDFLLALAYLG